MIVVTGASGFIGSAILRHLRGAGVGVARVTRDEHERNESRVYLSKYTSADLALLFQELQPTAIIHTAGSASVADSLRAPDLDFRNSVDVYQRVLEAVRLSAKLPRVVLLTSAAVYGNPLVLPVNEGSLLKPISPYGFHKKICEELAQEYTQCYQIPTTVARIFSVFGVGQRRLLIWDLVRKFLDDECVQLSGTGEETRDFLHVDDLAAQICQLVEHARLPHEVFNLGSGEARSVRQVAESVRRILGSSKEIVFDGSIRPGDPRAWQADISRLERQIGPPLIHDFEVRLDQTIEGWLK